MAMALPPLKSRLGLFTGFAGLFGSLGMGPDSSRDFAGRSIAGGRRYTRVDSGR
jgi:hypothetical protein